ncbi:hypothetical protein [Pseudaestuariivita rosea]|uniref:hypothetical protein n=1 Tax=Pseudaestuariivita rosea TaxID=2763263 RepID=UPI001ABBBB87|nr:hypothetical protein [Pseudaestuariivita rosea]
MRRRIFAMILISLTGIIGLPAWSQETSIPVTTGQPNFVYGQFELLENHQGCSDDHQIAYRVPFVAQDISYIIADETLNPRAIVENGTITGSHGKCFSTEMRGTERIQFEIGCTEDEETRFLEEIKNLNLSVSMQGSATLCISPLDWKLTESEWQVTVSNKDGQLTYTDNGTEVAVPQNEPLLSAGDNGSAMSFQHLQSWYWSQLFENPRIDLFLEFNPTEFNMLSTQLACIPAFSQHDTLEPLYIVSEAFVAIINDERTTCISENCPRLRRFNGLSGIRTMLHEERSENAICPLEINK